jgi:hypothetical protein
MTWGQAGYLIRTLRGNLAQAYQLFILENCLHHYHKCLAQASDVSAGIRGVALIITSGDATSSAVTRRRINEFKNSGTAVNDDWEDRAP